MLPEDWREKSEYDAWHRAVKKRWAPICQDLWGDPEACPGCGRREWVEIHHPYPAAFYPHLVYHPANGIPGCRPPGGRGCHNKIDPQLYAAGRDPWEKVLHLRARRRRQVVREGTFPLEAAAVWLVFGNVSGPVVAQALRPHLPAFVSPAQVRGLAGVVVYAATYVVVVLLNFGWVLVRRVR